MRRPDWAGSQYFAPTWTAMVRALTAPLAKPATYALSLLEEARVIVVPSEQVLVLPRFANNGEIADVLAHEPLLFDPLFIEHGLLPFEDSEGPVLGTNFSGLLLTEKFAPPNRENSVREGAALMGFLRTNNSIVTNGTVNVPWRHADDSLKMESILPGGAINLTTEDVLMGLSFAELAARILRFLNCINVDLIDAPMSRQERRANERKGGQIAQIVHIRQNQKRNEPEDHSKVDWSHRWEVRGHYKHFPVGTKLADAAPDKVSWEPKRQEYVRRIWCPPFVKGPANKPLIPKTHVVA